MGDPIQQFALSIMPIGPSDRPDERFWVRTEQVPKGVPLAEEEVVWPLDRWIDQAQLLSGDPLVALLNPQDAASQTPLAFGEMLYGEVFKGRIRDSWLIAQGVAQSQQQILQLRLGLKGDRLPRLPWEALSGDGRTLTTGTEVTFSRYRMQFGHQSAARDNIDQLRFHHRLRILMAVSEPDDRDRLELAQEVEQLQGELAKLQTRDQPLDITIDVVQQPDRETLTQALEQGKYQIFHYAGHSSSGPYGGNLHLVSRRTGLTEMLSGQDLAGLLVNNGVLLAFFNSCQGSYTAAGATPSSLLAKDTAVIDNLAAALVERGVPGVLAMSESIPDDVALTLMQLFYRNLRPGYSIDLSLSRVRQGLVSSYGSDRFYWALPILYLHQDFDGYLFKPAIAPLSSPTLGWEIAQDDDEQLSPDLDVASPVSGARPAVEPPTPGSPTPGTTADSGDNRPSPEPVNQSGRSPGLIDLVLPNFPRLMRPAPTDPPPAESPALSPNSPTVDPALTNPDRLPQGRRNLRWIVGGMVIATVGAGGLLWNPGSQNSTPPVPAPSATPSNSISETSETTVNPCTAEAITGLNDVETKPVLALGENCRQAGDWAAVLTVVEALLRPNRNALAAAATLLQGLPGEGQTADYYFLLGRLAWQAEKTGQTDFGSLQDAIRHWQTAIAQNPQAIPYRTALGFALYQNSDFNGAQTQWTQAVKLAEADPTLSVLSNPSETQKQRQQDQARLDARAGLALISWEKARATETLGDRQSHLKNVQFQLNKINTADALGFQANALSNRWLWSQLALVNWQQLLQSKPERS